MLYYMRAFKKNFISEQRAMPSPLVPLDSSGPPSKEKVLLNPLFAHIVPDAYTSGSASQVLKQSTLSLQCLSLTGLHIARKPLTVPLTCAVPCRLCNQTH